ncbi:MAG: DUF2332 family protein [Rhizobiaceae bacterium]
MSHRVREAFKEQAEVCGPMGSPFTAGLCNRFGEHLDHSSKVGAFCLDWPGDPGPSADSIPLRICGGFHALVLSQQDEALAAEYPPHKLEAPAWPALERALHEHESFLLDWMQSVPQTNEVSRSSVIYPALMTIAERCQQPLSLLEVGASGGLNLRADRFSYDLGGQQCGEPGSQLHLVPQWQGSLPKIAAPDIASRSGCDLNPLDPLDPADELRLRAYVWPDQADRKARIDAALLIARDNPATVDRQDAVQWLGHQLANLPEATCTVIYSTIAWQYLPKPAQEAGEDLIFETGQALVGTGRQLAWLRFEADGESPGGGIRLQMWPDGLDCLLGRADFHARWVDWRGL